MIAAVILKDGKRFKANVNKAYSMGNQILYNLTENISNVLGEFKAGETKTYNKDEIESIKYVMN